MRKSGHEVVQDSTGDLTKGQFRQKRQKLQGKKRFKENKKDGGIMLSEKAAKRTKLTFQTLRFARIAMK